MRNKNTNKQQKEQATKKALYSWRGNAKRLKLILNIK